MMGWVACHASRSHHAPFSATPRSERPWAPQSSTTRRLRLCWLTWQLASNSAALWSAVPLGSTIKVRFSGQKPLCLRDPLATLPLPFVPFLCCFFVTFCKLPALPFCNILQGRSNTYFASIAKAHAGDHAMKCATDAVQVPYSAVQFRTLNP